MFEQAFKNIDDVLRKEAGCTTELDYTEQSSWLLFLKYLDALEADKATEAALDGKKYSFILDKPYRWDAWAAPKDEHGALDHNKALTGDDLRDFVNGKLFPYLHGFKQRATGPDTIEYKVGEIFGEIKNKIQSGYNLREIIDHIDELRFRSQTEKSDLFDVLAHIAYALPPQTREFRANNAKAYINSQFTTKQQAFLNFVLSHYVDVGVEELSQDKLKPLLLIKYNNSIQDAVADLGRPEEIGTVFAGFQKYLYHEVA